MTRKIVPYGGGAYRSDPPIDREDAERCFGAAIPQDAWSAIEVAFMRHAARMASLQAPRANRNRNDPRSFEGQRARAVKLLETARKGIAEIHPGFLLACEMSHRLAEYSRSGTMPPSYRMRQELDRIARRFFAMLLVIEQAEPEIREVPSKAESRRILAREVYEALKPHGARLSNGWEIASGEPSYADLTGFERLIEALGIHQGATPAATARWLRDALGEDR